MRLYARKDWQALGTDCSKWSYKQRAIRKRWVIFYARRAKGLASEPRQPRHWVGPIERAKKQAKLLKPSINPALFRHL